MRLNILNDTLENRISFALLAAFLVCLPFDRLYSEVILICLAAHQVLHLDRSRLRLLLDKEVWLLQSIFIWIALNAFRSTHRQEALDEVVKLLAVVVFPALFRLLAQPMARYRDTLLLVFSYSCAATIAGLYGYALYVLRVEHLPLQMLFSYYLNHQFSAAIDMHATYLSAYCALCFVFCCTRLVQTTHRQKLVYLLPALLLLAGMLQLCAKSVLVATILTMLFFFPWMVLKPVKRWRFRLVVLLLLALATLLVVQHKGFHSRLITDLQQDLSTQRPAFAAQEKRLVRWQLAAGLVSRAPVWGYAPGDHEFVLRNAYFDHRFYHSYLENLNTHNQFLDLWLSVGITGVLLYACTLAYGFKTAITSKDILLTAFLLLTLLVSLSENNLEVNKGIFFYAFFFSLLLMRPDRLRKNATV
jgi:O-antigen ligase